MEKEEYTCVGHSVPKVDVLDKVLGRALYSEDMTFPGMLYGKVLRAGLPHAVIEDIDLSAARAMGRSLLTVSRLGQKNGNGQKRGRSMLPPHC